MVTPLKNWAGNLQYSSKNVYFPKSVKEVQEIVIKCEYLTTLGSRHSFNTIADNTENQICLQDLNRIIALDKKAKTVTIEAGVRYSDLAPYLHEQGFALPNMASLPHISVVGACVTATHGSGVKYGNLATSVSAVEFISASGDLVTSTKKDKDFYGAVVTLGALGVITKLTLDLQPTFQMKQVVYQDLPMSELKDNFHELQSRGYSISLFTTWENKNINQVWIKSKIEEGDVTPEELDLYGAKRATKKIHPAEGLAAEPLTEQLGIPGPWFERMPHFKIGFQPSVGAELQSEFYVPIEHAYDAIMAIEALQDKISPHLYISEIRTIGADNLWMSPCYNKTCVAIHTTWKQEPEVLDLIPLVERQLEPFGPVPHWAKLFTMPPSVLQSRFERIADFRQLAAKYDPDGKFRNDFLHKNLYSLD